MSEERRSEYWTPKEYAREMRVCFRTVQNWIARRDVPGLNRVGGRWRIEKRTNTKTQ